MDRFKLPKKKKRTEMSSISLWSRGDMNATSVFVPTFIYLLFYFFHSAPPYFSNDNQNSRDTIFLINELVSSLFDTKL